VSGKAPPGANGGAVVLVRRALGLCAAERHLARRATATPEGLCALVASSSEDCGAFSGRADLRRSLDDAVNRGATGRPPTGASLKSRPYCAASNEDT
jgi:hypothetical protein